MDWGICQLTSLNIAMKALADQIEILKERFDYAVRQRDRYEELYYASIEDCADKKRELDLAMEEKRRLTRMKLGERVIESEL
jgi:hypothetical protein